MSYEPKNFEYLLGIKGFSSNLLKNHFMLYSGYVTNTNKLIELLNGFLKEGKTAEPEYAELKRRFGWEFNGMRLHEFYFKNMTKVPKEPDRNSEFFKKIAEDFGSFDNWKKDFKSAGIMRGIGWVILYYDPVAGKFFNTWINEHDVGHLSGTIPILIMDVFEHSYMADYSLKRADYIDSFFEVIDWTVVVKRFNRALK